MLKQRNLWTKSQEARSDSSVEKLPWPRGHVWNDGWLYFPPLTFKKCWVIFILKGKRGKHLVWLLNCWHFQSLAVCLWGRGDQPSFLACYFGCLSRSLSSGHCGWTLDFDPIGDWGSLDSHPPLLLEPQPTFCPVLAAVLITVTTLLTGSRFREEQFGSCITEYRPLW